MIKCYEWPVGICSWSIKDDLGTLQRLIGELGLDYVHLNCGPGLAEGGENFLAAIDKQGWKISCAMVDFAQEDYSTPATIKLTGGIVPEEYWDINRQRVSDAIDLTAKLQVEYLSTHFGFIELEDSDSAKKLIDRTRVLADKAAEKNIQLLMETGQETADELRQFLEELNHPALGVNFDPANMILYDKGEPIKAVETLAPWIKHVHIKDGI
ncbi:MAG: sugar phosphate isomerase/epimerase family protein, partial [Planctomycetota bacterium]